MTKKAMKALQRPSMTPWMQLMGKVSHIQQTEIQVASPATFCSGAATISLISPQSSTFAMALNSCGPPKRAS